MGNLNQSYSHGNIFVQTDKPYYNSGDTVTGTVYVDMNTLFPGETIFLKVKGYEMCYWNEKRTKWEDEYNADGTKTQKSVEYFEHFNGRNSFYSNKFALNSWGGHIPMGQYSLPFSFVL